MTATEPVDPTNAVGRLLPEGWRVERTFAYEGGTLLVGGFVGVYCRSKRVPHGETVDCVIETLLYGLTIQQPYASLIAHGIKNIETRGFQPRVVKPGDDLAIIAGAKRPTVRRLPPTDYVVGEWSTGGLHADDEDGECPCPDPEDGNWSDECKALNAWTPAILRDERAHGYSLVGMMPLGAVVAVARFVEALPMLPPGDLTRPHIGLDQLPTGEWVPTCIYRPGVMPDRSPMDQYPYGQWAPGRFGWLLDNIRRLPEPIPCTGFQGLRALPADVATATRQAAQ